MVKQLTTERRAGVRAKHVLSIQYRLAKLKSKKSDRTWRLSTTQDMSFCGLAFFADRAYKMGDVLDIMVVMSGVLDIYTGKAKVVRVERKKNAAYYLIALQFMESRAKKRKAKTYSRNKRSKNLSARKKVKKVKEVKRK